MGVFRVLRGIEEVVAVRVAIRSIAATNERHLKIKIQKLHNNKNSKHEKFLPDPKIHHPDIPE